MLKVCANKEMTFQEAYYKLQRYVGSHKDPELAQAFEVIYKALVDSELDKNMLKASIKLTDKAIEGWKKTEEEVKELKRLYKNSRISRTQLRRYINKLKEKEMTVKDLLFVLNDSIIASVVNSVTELTYLKPSKIGGLLGSGHWVLNEKIKEVTIANDILYISVVVE